MDGKRPIDLLIGPEGGFDLNEVSFAREKLGAESVSLGPGSEFELQPGGASFRDPKGGTGAIYHRYGYRGND
ncbi:16S rRNA (uracil(1498)-N(3))-methyltransferase [Desulfosporosinus nitroreducens]|uniref:16S rRNA (uracil(1498)-N(3))-methyltransferase n=1 Tax=Desulfosporosinus nitroreducens TaxID=2018668 RepID=UPI0028526E0D|nr:16S rRNA (uracil(1498)-N(3))-methyltransferase [Desulfosporosinus nitroreducens]